MVFPSCDGGKCFVNVAYNKQIPLCTSALQPIGSCRDANNLCVADPAFKFDLDEYTDNDVRYVSNVDTESDCGKIGI